MFSRRTDMVQCPACGGKGKVYWDFGHNSRICLRCDGKKYITLEEYIRGKGQSLGYSGKMLEAYVDDYFDRN